MQTFGAMPDKKTVEAARKDKAEGKSPSTQAGEFVREEMDHIREGKHGARSSKQAIAIGLSKARRAGVKLGKPKTGSARTKKQAARDSAKGSSGRITAKKPSKKRSRASTRALKKEGTAAASPRALSRHAHAAAKKRTAGDRSASAKKAARTKGPTERSRAAKKAARTRASHASS